MTKSMTVSSNLYIILVTLLQSSKQYKAKICPIGSEMEFPWGSIYSCDAYNLCIL